MSTSEPMAPERPMKPCVICHGTGKVANLDDMRRNPRKRCDRKECAWCAGTGKVFVSSTDH
jgi:DnaJ-class molecular chaperone